MAEPQTATVTSKPKPKPVATSASAFEMPKFEMPKFEMPKMEVPAAFREVAEKGVAQAKENYEKMKTAAEDATEMLEDTYATASKGCSDYGLKLIETARANSNAAFDLFGELLTAKSYSEVVELYHRLYARAVRHHERAGQGTCRSRAEGRDRDRRADQGKLHQRLQQGRVTIASITAALIAAADRKPGRANAWAFALCEAGRPRRRRPKAKPLAKLTP